LLDKETAMFQRQLHANLSLVGTILLAMGCKSSLPYSNTGSNASPTATADGGSAPGLARLSHIVVVVLENWSFDSLYGQFAGADGLANAGGAATQVDATGTPYPALPQTETHLPQTLPKSPHELSQAQPQWLSYGLVYPESMFGSMNESDRRRTTVHSCRTGVLEPRNDALTPGQDC